MGQDNEDGKGRKKMRESDIASIQMTTGEWGKGKVVTLAYATVTLTNGLMVKGVKVLRGDKGLFVGLPQRTTVDKKTNEKTFEDCIAFAEKDDFFAFSNAVKKEYNAKVGGGERSQSQSQSGAKQSNTRSKPPVQAAAPTNSFVDDDGLDFIS